MAFTAQELIKFLYYKYNGDMKKMIHHIKEKDEYDPKEAEDPKYKNFLRIHSFKSCLDEDFKTPSTFQEPLLVCWDADYGDKVNENKEKTFFVYGGYETDYNYPDTHGDSKIWMMGQKDDEYYITELGLVDPIWQGKNIVELIKFVLLFSRNIIICEKRNFKTEGESIFKTQIGMLMDSEYKIWVVPNKKGSFSNYLLKNYPVKFMDSWDDINK